MDIHLAKITGDCQARDLKNGEVFSFVDLPDDWYIKAYLGTACVPNQDFSSDVSAYSVELKTGEINLLDGRSKVVPIIGRFEYRENR